MFFAFGLPYGEQLFARSFFESRSALNRIAGKMSSYGSGQRRTKSG
jgi:hypothetical protein